MGLMEIITLKDFLAMEIKEEPGLIGGGLLHRNNITFVTGPSKLGKSKFAINLALCLSRGEDFLEMFPIKKQYKVLYIQQEINPKDVQDRFRTIGGIEGKENENLSLVNMYDLEVDRNKVFYEMKEEIMEHAPDVIILDPLSWFHSLDENSAQDMKFVIKRIRSFTEGGRAVIILHHTGKPPRNQEEMNPALEGGYANRGSSVLFDLGAAYMTLWPDGTNERHRLFFSLRYHAPLPGMIIERDKQGVYSLIQIENQNGIESGAVVEILKLRRQGKTDINNRIVRKGQFKLDVVQRAERWLENI